MEVPIIKNIENIIMFIFKRFGMKLSERPTQNITKCV